MRCVIDMTATISALTRQVECYQRLAKLAQTQHEHVQQGQVEALLEVLAARQEVLDQITALERDLAPARKRWGEYVQSLDDAARPLAERLLNEMRLLLEQITAADRDDALILQQQKLNVGRQIGQASAARVVGRGYAAAAGAYDRQRQSNMDVQQ
jgi:hypothetical protein